MGSLPAAVVGYGDGGWVSAGGCSPEELSSPLASVRVGVCTRTDSQNKPVPVWEISVKSVFCKSWPGSCFHITNQKQLDVFLGASAFPNPFTALSLPLEMEKMCSRASMEVCQQLIPFGGAGHHIIGWPWCDCSKKGRKNLCWGVRTSLQKGFCSPGAYKKGMSTDTLDPAVSLPLSLYKLYLLQPFRNIGQGWVFFYPEVPEHLRLKIVFCPLPLLFLLHWLSLVGGQLLTAVSCTCPSLPSEKHLLGVF